MPTLAVNLLQASEGEKQKGKHLLLTPLKQQTKARLFALNSVWWSFRNVIVESAASNGGSIVLSDDLAYFNAVVDAGYEHNRIV
jgi:hypothetical protein